MRTYTINHRDRIVVNTDPLRRCYNGCHFSSALQWLPWAPLELEVKEEDVKRKLAYWRSLNDYAVSQRGESAYSEFEAVEDSV
jgi:hypothetical protein